MEFLETFEKTCLQLQFSELQTRKAAELDLIQWRSHPDALSLFSEILKKTTNSFCQFQAVLIIKEVLIKRWDELSSQVKGALEQFFLQFIEMNQLEIAVENIILQIVAIMNKKTWQEHRNQSEEEAHLYYENLFQRITQIFNNNKMSGEYSLKQGLGIRWLGALVSEFSFRDSKSNALGLSWEKHHACFQSFQRIGLPHSFYLSIEHLKWLVNQNFTNQNSIALQLLKDGLILVNQILDWDFEVSAEYQNISFHSNLNKSNIINLDSTWRKLLFENENLQFFFQLSNNLKFTEEFIHLNFSIIGQLVSISGSIFEEPSTMKLHYFSQIMNGVIDLVKNCNFHQLIQVTSLADVYQKLGSNLKWEGICSVVDIVQPFLQEAVDFTLKCLEMLSSSNDESNIQSLENSFDILLQFWVLLLEEAKDDNRLNNNNRLFQFGGQIFSKYVETRLILANRQFNQFQEEEKNTSDITQFRDQLESVCFLGRLVPLNSFSILYSSLQSRFITWKTIVDSITTNNQQIPPNFYFLLEEIHWLMLLLGHLMADEGEGEIPEIPAEFQNLIHNDTHLVVEITFLVFKLMNFELECLNANNFTLASPLLGQTFIWFLIRWCKSYLMGNLKNQSLIKAFGSKDQGGNGIELLDFIIHKIFTNFEKWNGEIPLLKYTSELILTISLCPKIASSLFSLSSWTKLLDLYLQGHPIFSIKISLDIQTTLLESFIDLSEFSGTNKEETMKYFWQIVGPLKINFQNLVNQSNFHQIAQNPAVIQTLCSLLARFRGIARASISNSQTIFFACSDCFPIFNQIVEIYSTPPTVSLMVLQFYFDFCECQSENLERESAELLFSALVDVIQRYTKTHLSQVKFQSSLFEQKKKEEYKGFLFILKLLSMMASNSNAKTERAAVFNGLSFILPLITKELLQIPKFCHKFFALISTLFQECSKKIVELQPQLFQSLIDFLQFGVQHIELEVALKSIEGLIALVKYNLKVFQKTQKPALISQLEMNPQLLNNLLRFTLEFLLFNDFSSEIIGPLSHLLFGLICSNQQTYFSLINELIHNFEGTPNKQRLVEAFNNLLNPSQIQLNLTRKNFQQFEQNTFQFIRLVKGFLIKK